MEIQFELMNSRIENLSQIIKEKGWQNKDLQMNKAEVMAEYHVCLGRQRQIVDVMSYVEFEMTGGIN